MVLSLFTHHTERYTTVSECSTIYHVKVGATPRPFFIIIFIVPNAAAGTIKVSQDRMRPDIIVKDFLIAHAELFFSSTLWSIQ